MIITREFKHGCAVLVALIVPFSAFADGDDEAKKSKAIEGCSSRSRWVSIGPARNWKVPKACEAKWSS